MHEITHHTIIRICAKFEVSEFNSFFLQIVPKDYKTTFRKTSLKCQHFVLKLEHSRAIFYTIFSFYLQQCLSRSLIKIFLLSPPCQFYLFFSRQIFLSHSIINFPSRKSKLSRTFAFAIEPSLKQRTTLVAPSFSIWQPTKTALGSLCQITPFMILGVD